MMILLEATILLAGVVPVGVEDRIRRTRRGWGIVDTWWRRVDRVGVHGWLVDGVGRLLVVTMAREDVAEDDTTE